MQPNRYALYGWLAAAMTTAAFAQQATIDKPPAFEIVSIKPSPPPGGPVDSARVIGSPYFKTATVDPMLFSTRRSTLNGLIRYAYDVEDFQLAGGPGWAETDRYDVDAHPANPSTADQMMPMLRALLADRFQLTFHRETKILPLNVLTVAAGGPKFGPQFHPVNEDDPPAPPAKHVLNQVHSRHTIKTFAGVIRMNLMIDRVTHVTSDLRDIPPVLDQTGLSGTYDITVDISGEDAWPALLERQLGLKLELRKAPTEIIVIDRAVKPSGN